LTLWWYYRRPSVVATCEMHDPGRDWTAACPRPLLVLVIVYAAYASMLVGLIVSGGPVPVGSTVVSGLGASLLGLVLTAWFMLLAYGTFKAQGWAAVAGCATAVLLAAQQFLMDQEALMATFTQDPSAQAYMMEGMNVQASNMVSGVLIATFLIGYTVYHRNSFGSQQAVEHS
jgi:hypothetical protein